MNKNFEWSRFFKVLKKDFFDIWPNMGSTMLFLILLPAAIWVLQLVSEVVFGSNNVTDSDTRRFLIGSMCWLAGIMTPSRMYGRCNLGKKGIYWAMLPASKLEKYISMLLMCIIVCPIIVLIGNYLMDVILTLLPFGPYHQWVSFSSDVSYPILIHGANVDQASLLLAFVVGLYITTLFNKLVFIFTNTIFKKHKVAKTILCLFAFYFVLFLMMIPVYGYIILPHEIALLDWLREGVHFAGFIWICNAFNLLLCALLIWWTGRRLKNMAY